MITFDKFVPEEIEETFLKYLEKYEIRHDADFYRKVNSIEDDVRFFQEYMDRTEKRSGFSFSPRIKAFAYNGFMKMIDKSHYGRYNYKILKEQLYLYEVLRQMTFLKNLFPEDEDINMETVREIKEMFPVVEYYMEEVEGIDDYIYAFIGSNHLVRRLKNALEKID